MIQIEIPTVTLKEDVKLPYSGSKYAAGKDLYALIQEPIFIQPFETVVIETGLAMAIPGGLCGLILPRSGLAIKHNIGVINAPGLIDSDYRGEIKVGLHNFGKEAYELKPGERIAQLVIIAYKDYINTVVSSLDDTERGEGGFGSSGKF